MRKLLFFQLFTILLLFSHCKNEKKKETSGGSELPQTNTAEVAQSKGFYKHFKGTVDSLLITMDLVQTVNSGGEREPVLFKGHYYYDKFQQPIVIYGNLDSMGNVILYETDLEDNSIFFSGKLDANGSFSGTWKDEARKKTMPFALKESNSDGTMAFQFHSFSDSLKLWEKVAETPVATFDFQTLLPNKNAPNADFLRNQIFMGIKGDSTEQSYTNLSVENLQKTLRDSFFAGYRETLKDEKPEEAGATMNYAESSSVSVLFNEKDLLSLGFEVYNYSGGAHGSFGTGLASYDLTEKKALKLTDVFLPKFEKTLDAALTGAAKQKLGLKKNQKLSTYYFDDAIKHTSNFCITPKGALFLYNPYEIAAYAYGQVELFIPFSSVKNIVNPRFLK